jgi:hypothetical protein
MEVASDGSRVVIIRSFALRSRRPADSAIPTRDQGTGTPSK